MNLLSPPKAELWPRWELHDPKNVDVIQHSAWDVFLEKYLDSRHASGIARINYQAVRKEDQIKLSNYIKTLESLPISSYNRKEQTAYWINLYNARTVRLILEYYPVKSILDIDISPGFLKFGPWGAKLLSIEGEKLSLNDIEHRILRPIIKDSRIHYALNCASIGCPNIAPVSYTSQNLEQLLEESAKAFVNHPRGVRFEEGKLTVSKIYTWFEEDFGGNKEGVIKHLKKYASSQLLKQLENHSSGFDDDYNWDLNES